MRLWQCLSILCGGLMVSGCSERQGTFEVNFLNNSTSRVWVESAKILRGDVGCGNLEKGASKELIFPKVKESPGVISIEWWKGTRERPNSQGEVFSKTFALKQYDEKANVWKLSLELTEDQDWKITQE